jgi:hypothetical protein
MQANALNAQTVQQFIVYKQAEGFNFEIAVNKTFTTCGDGYWSNVVKEVFVTSISMYIGTVQEDDYFGDGDLAVNYTEATWDNAKDGLIYTDSEFLHCVREFLINAGFNVAAVEDISYSEQGMQDDERVSCDAYAFANYIRTLSNIKITIVE